MVSLRDPFEEMRVQSVPTTIEELKGKEIYATVKLDGTSCSIYANNEFERPFGVCSRELELKEVLSNTLWQMAYKYKLQEKLQAYSEPVVIQGELCGPGLQKNRLKLLIHDWYVFDIYFPKRLRYASYQELTDMCTMWQLNMVPVEIIKPFDYTLDTLLEAAKGKYKGTDNDREGIVIRPTTPTYSPTLAGRLSIKVLNNDFLLQNEDAYGN